MCSEIDHYSRRMSGSDKPGNSSPPMSEKLTSCPQIVTEIETVDRKRGNPDDHHKVPEEIDHKATVSDIKSDKQIPEDDDGFKTPTSSDYRIPAITQCPPAPKKPRPQSPKLKRKASQSPPRSPPFDASTAEVESIFRPIPNDEGDEPDRKMKKARTGDKDRT